MQTINRKGFSLVELLTSIAVISILASIIISAVGSAREAGDKAKCAANLRQLGTATLLYCNDHRGQFPMTTHDTGRNQETGVYDQSWVYTLAPYVGNVDDIRISPGDPMAEQRREQRASSYLLNDYIAVVKKDFDFLTASFIVEEDLTNIMSLPNPADTVIVFTCADNLPVSIDREHTHARDWVSFADASTEIQPDRYKGGANYLYADGHVAFLTASELEAKFADGINIAEPPLF